MAEGEQSLHHSREAARRLEVADVRLHAAESDRAFCSGCTHRRLDAVNFRRIAEFGARAVSLDIADIVRADSCLSPCGSQKLSLSLRVGRGERDGMSGVALRAASDHTEDPVSIRFRGDKWL